MTGASVRYKRPVVMANSVIAGYEEGSGSIDGQKINLKGAWKNGASGYEATYNGNFVRRGAPSSPARKIGRITAKPIRAPVQAPSSARLRHSSRRT